MDRDSPGEQGRHGLRVVFPALMTSLCEARVREMLNTSSLKFPVGPPFNQFTRLARPSTGDIS
jgi:hypothetical protein